MSSRSGLYWLSVQLAAVGAGIYAGIELFRAVAG